MFYNLQEEKFQKKYIDNLTIIGALSRLFSESKTPYLYYRVAENIFCDAFNANNLSRGDIALDAAKDKIGIGLKTFLKNNNKTMQKIAEFNRDRELYNTLNSTEIVKIISKIRNERVHFAQKISNVDKSFYHCVLREDSKFYLYEEEMSVINITQIKEVKKNKNSIWFHDESNEYVFNLSKSTLLKRFNTSSYLKEFEVEILENPLQQIQKCFNHASKQLTSNELIQETVYLPLYGKDKVVSLKSALNQWNGGGRVRDINEIYIPIPAKVHKYSPNFFPPRDKPFTLLLPNKETLSVKVCQDNSKALMSNPNKALGKWLLREVLELKEEEILDYKRLQIIGIDSVRIDKIDNQNYKISFAFLGSFEKYLEQHQSYKGNRCST